MTDNVFNPGELPVGAVDTLRGPLDGNGGVSLPFAAPLIYWKNGDARNKKEGGVSYFGGWAVGVEDLEKMKVAPFEGWNLETWINAEGKEYDTYSARWLGFAPIAKRFRWFVNKDGKGRGQLNILGMAALWDNDVRGFLSAGPVVLKGEGYAANHIENALKTWERESAQARKQFASNLPSNFFYAMIGTFGETPQTEMVGKESKSPITPCRLQPPKEINAGWLQAAYLGASVIGQAAEYKTQAAEWIAEWSKTRKDGGNDNDGPNYGHDDSGLPF